MRPTYLSSQYIFLLHKEYNKVSNWPNAFLNCVSTIPIELNPYQIAMPKVPLLPRIDLSINLSLDECVYLSVQRLEKIDRKLLVYWSGGLDSTAIIAAIDKFGSQDLRNRTYIAATNGSILENVEGYKYLKTKYKFISANSDISVLAKEYLIVPGHSSDRLCYSSTTPYIVAKHGEDVLCKPYKELFTLTDFSYFSNYEPIIDYSPVPIKTVYDFLWWHALSQCAVSSMQLFRSIELENRNFVNEIFHFFDTDEFISWSINHFDKGLPSKKWPNAKAHLNAFCKEHFPVELITTSQYPSNWYYYYLQINIACEFDDGATFNYASQVEEKYKQHLLDVKCN
jgi:hypothetical protein